MATRTICITPESTLLCMPSRLAASLRSRHSSSLTGAEVTAPALSGIQWGRTPVNWFRKQEVLFLGEVVVQCVTPFVSHTARTGSFVSG